MASIVFLMGACGSTAGAPVSDPSGAGNAVDAAGGGEDSGVQGDIPDIGLESVDGEGSVRLRSLARDRVLVIVFWSTYCDSCKSELQRLKVLYKELAGRGLEILAVSMDKPDTASDVMSEVHKYALPFPVVFDTESRASGPLNPTGAQPFTVVVDTNMEIVYTHESFFPGDIDKLRKVVLDALGE